MAIVHPDYTMLANRVSVRALHKRTPTNIRDVANNLYNFVDSCGRPAGLLDSETYNIMIDNADVINAKLDFNRDYAYDFFGYKTLEKSYLLRTEDRKIAERPQHLLMRVSIGIHGKDLDSAFETYDLMSQ